MSTGAALLIFAAAQAAIAAPTLLSGTTRTELQRHDLSVPGWEMIQARVDFAPRAAAAKHKHPGEEIIYVLRGRIEYRLEGQAPVALGPGGVLFVPYGKPHAAVNLGQEPAMELATYFVEKGKPLVVPVP